TRDSRKYGKSSWFWSS
ncbi:hypothetical protein D037_1480B, partial [Vibrio parahaemolyticus IDH02640]